MNFLTSVTAIVGPNGSGKSNIAESFRFVLGEQSLKSMRGKRSEDMIFNGSVGVRRSNFAEVCLFFDNSDRKFPGVDFDEVSIKRVVHRDGENNYSINGSRARLKDIIGLLSAVHIGASAHHIISQGQTDRILSAKPLERRSMVEEALGLKIYHYKKRESEKKLSKTEDNLKEIAIIRREIAPRIVFLKERVEKIERARNIQSSLANKYREYLKREYLYINHNRKALEEEKKEPEKQLIDKEEEIRFLKEELTKEEGAEGKASGIFVLEEEQRELENHRGEIMREIGRLEGEISFRKSQLLERVERIRIDPTITWKEASSFLDEVDQRIIGIEKEETVESVKRMLGSIRELIKSFLESFGRDTSDDDDKNRKMESEILSLENEKAERLQNSERLKSKIDKLTHERTVLRDEIDKERNVSREAERRMFECMNTEQIIRSRLEKIKDKLARLEQTDARFKHEIQEACRIIGVNVLDYKEYEIRRGDEGVLSEEEIINELGEEQERRKREIERDKILLEELSVGSFNDTLREYKDITERDEFLAREVADLERSIGSLRSVIVELEETIKTRFDEGVKKINIVFQELFVEIFGGGNAFLKKIQIKNSNIDAFGEESEEDEADPIDGLEISVSLPRKNIKGLLMLSGGERALTSIALIFAMSQVNPPPFIVLDETDSALDEANSQRYGSLVEKLAERSQLILITHNRETMARAGVLYGVTMNPNGVSGLLSVRLGEGAPVPK